MITVLSQSDNRLEKHVVLRLLYLLRLFPDIFPETFCNDMLVSFTNRHSCQHCRMIFNNLF